MTDGKGVSRGGFRPRSVSRHRRGARRRGAARPNCVVRSNVLSPGVIRRGPLASTHRFNWAWTQMLRAAKTTVEAASLASRFRDRPTAAPPRRPVWPPRSGVWYADATGLTVPIAKPSPAKVRWPRAHPTRFLPRLNSWGSALHKYESSSLGQPIRTQRVLHGAPPPVRRPRQGRCGVTDATTSGLKGGHQPWRSHPPTVSGSNGGRAA